MLISPFAGRGFPFGHNSTASGIPIRQDPLVGYWNGEDVAYYSDGSWAPVPPSAKHLLVGPNTDCPLGLTLQQAAHFYWSWRTLKFSGTFSMSASVPAFSYVDPTTNLALAVRDLSLQPDYDMAAHSPWMRKVFHYAKPDPPSTSQLVARRTSNIAHVYELVLPPVGQAISLYADPNPASWLMTDFDTAQNADGTTTVDSWLGTGLNGGGISVGISPQPVAFFDGKYWLRCAPRGSLSCQSTMLVSTGQPYGPSRYIRKTTDEIFHLAGESRSGLYGRPTLPSPPSLSGPAYTVEPTVDTDFEFLSLHLGPDTITAKCLRQHVKTTNTSRTQTVPEVELPDLSVTADFGAGVLLEMDELFDYSAPAL